MLNTMKILMKKIPNLKLVIRISKYKNTFPKGYTQSWSEEVFVVSKIKKTAPWNYVISDLNGEKVFMERNCKKLVMKNSEYKRYSKEKVINCMSNGKDTTIHLIVGLIKKTSYKNESILS